MKGRKPKPTHLKLVAGNPGKRALNRGEPVPEGDLTDPPEWLTPEQKESWRYAIDHAPSGLLKKLDRSALTVWVVAEDLHRQATQAVAKFGLITKSPKQGEPIQNPYLPIVNRQAQIMLKAAAELGFTPSSRSRVTVNEDVEEESPARKYLT
nr:MAG: phage terminase small subunit P27 family [Pseudomonadota bacterium]